MIASRRSPPSFDQRQHVAVAPVRVQAVDTHGHELALPVDAVQRRDDIVARGILVCRRNGILQIETDRISPPAAAFSNRTGRDRVRRASNGKVVDARGARLV